MGSATIDLNADLGENSPERIVGDDEAMLRIVTSANVSCGFHAGTTDGIRTTLAAAMRQGVAIGAHPSYRDYADFGRTPVDIDAASLQQLVEQQLGSLMALAASVGGSVSYVKPHGALYNTIAHDTRQAQAVVSAIAAIDPTLVLLGLAGGVSLGVAERAGLATAAEAFADRAYAPDGMLVPRTETGAVLHDPELVAGRMVRLAASGRIEAIDGSVISIRADSICVHGDSAGAVDMARSTRDALSSAGIDLRPFVRSNA